MPAQRPAQNEVSDSELALLETQSQGDYLCDGISGSFFEMHREDSMELVNDPRFFTTTVVEKRLTAFSGLATLGTLFIASSISQMFELKKNLDLGCCRPDQIRDWFQLIGFVLHMMVSFLLTTAVFVQVQQIFYTYRLLTAGPTGFEQASLFYLHPIITKWRHRAMKSFFSGIPFYCFASGWVLAVKFVKDAHAENLERLGELADDLDVSVNTTFRTFMQKSAWSVSHDSETVGELGMEYKAWIVTHPADSTPVQNLASLSMVNHTILAVIIMGIFTVFCCFLNSIRMSHLATFQLIQHDGHHKPVKDLTLPLRAGSSRSQTWLLET